MRLLDNALQQLHPGLGQALDGGRLEQVGGVSQGGPEALLGFEGVQGQVELGAAFLATEHLHLQPWNLQDCRALAGGGLVVEHHLEQRAVAQAALGLEGFHQLFEGQVLMLRGIQGAAFDLTQKVAKAQLPVDLGLEHLSIDEEADQTLGLDAVAVGSRHPDADVRLATVAMQQYLERGQQQHEQRDPFALGQLFQGTRQGALQADAMARALVALLQRPRMIQGQVQHLGAAFQLLQPVIQLPLALTGLHPLPLPGRVVRVLHRQRRQLGLLPLAMGAIELDQFLHHQLHRPAIGNDVVLDQHQYMLVRCQAHQGGPQQRSLAQVERLTYLGLDHLLDQVIGVAGLH